MVPARCFAAGIEIVGRPAVESRCAGRLAGLAILLLLLFLLLHRTEVLAAVEVHHSRTLVCHMLAVEDVTSTIPEELRSRDGP
jgi:hypothetical protein